MRAVVTPQRVREFIRDLVGENTLVNGIRFTDSMIEGAQEMAVAFFNEMPPFVKLYNVETFPYTYALMYGTVGQMLRGAAVGEASNAMNYSNDGVTVNDRETRMQLFSSLGDKFWGEYLEQCKWLKAQIQMNQAFGTSFSEFYLRSTR